MTELLRVTAEADDCPRRYCFFFVPHGASFTAGPFDSAEEGAAAAQPVVGDRCACTFGTCARLGGDRDWYEPCEPELEKAGLAVDHFQR